MLFSYSDSIIEAVLDGRIINFGQSDVNNEKKYVFQEYAGLIISGMSIIGKVNTYSEIGLFPAYEAGY